MKRIISFMVFLILSQNTFAGSYITTKHEFKSKDSDYNKTVNQIRFGYDKKIKNSTYYIEIGGGETLPNGKSLGSGQSIISYELGFKKKVNDKFSFKIQYEGKNYTDTYLDHELELETKYRF
ncbi:MAG: hypothetical protein VW837_04585 [Gammaproteobacteria bacterium]|jgi:hypothetical protein